MSTGKVTLLAAENLTLGTGNVLAALQTAAAGANLARKAIIKRLEIFQNATTTLQMIRGEIATRDTAGTLTTTSAAPKVVNPVGGSVSGFAGSTAPAGGTARSGINSSADSGGTYTQIVPFNFPNTAGYLFKPDQDEEIEIPESTLWVVRLLATPTSATGWGFQLWLMEK